MSDREECAHSRYGNWKILPTDGDAGPLTMQREEVLLPSIATLAKHNTTKYGVYCAYWPTLNISHPPESLQVTAIRFKSTRKSQIGAFKGSTGTVALMGGET